MEAVEGFADMGTKSHQVMQFIGENFNANSQESQRQWLQQNMMSGHVQLSMHDMDQNTDYDGED